MDIQSLTHAIYEDLEPQIVACRLADGNLVIELECTDWSGSARRRLFELVCSQVKESHVLIGEVGFIDFVDEHPVLLEHTGPQGGLYFSSKPACPAEVYLVAHQVLDDIFKGWIEPRHFLNGGPNNIHTYLAGGFGLLANGPLAALAPLCEATTPLLKLSLVQTHVAQGSSKALLLGSCWVVCEAVAVIERGD
ncbi:hypothetical protein [Chitinivorax sp. B]|uniref:hypothetical protein n=1 Tax=Chitinivorax sp. B TaxID=2502235 RepID=UPI0010F5F64D|nr:hypothetical protein [Chitinivorax sp. B]